MGHAYSLVQVSKMFQLIYHFSIYIYENFIYFFVLTGYCNNPNFQNLNFKNKLCGVKNLWQLLGFNSFLVPKIPRKSILLSRTLINDSVPFGFSFEFPLVLFGFGLTLNYFYNPKTPVGLNPPNTTGPLSLSLSPAARPSWCSPASPAPSSRHRQAGPARQPPSLSLILFISR